MKLCDQRYRVLCIAHLRRLEIALVLLLLTCFGSDALTNEVAIVSGEITSILRRDGTIRIDENLHLLEINQGVVIQTEIGGATVYVAEGYILSVSQTGIEVRFTHGEPTLGNPIKLRIFPLWAATKEHFIEHQQGRQDFASSPIQFDDIDTAATRFFKAFIEDDVDYIELNSTDSWMRFYKDRILGGKPISEKLREDNIVLSSPKTRCVFCGGHQCKAILELQVSPSDAPIDSEWMFDFEQSMAGDKHRVDEIELSVSQSMRDELMQLSPICR